jgi:hypothetical protein
MLVEHHIKYKEIHGVDETIWMEKAEHAQLHRKLRREGKCKIPPNELNRIARAASKRTVKAKELARKQKKKYELLFCQNVDLPTRADIYAYIIERITYNHKTGSVYIYTYLRSIKRAREL